MGPMLGRPHPQRQHQDKGDTSLVVGWTSSGDHDQFEVQYAAGWDERVLRVIGRLAEVALHDLHAGTEYTVCSIPQNEKLLECLAPAARQCVAQCTASLPSDARPVHAPLSHSHSAVGFGLTVTLLALAALALAITYGLRARPIQFQRYYDEDGSPPHHWSINQAKRARDSADERMEDGSRCPEGNVDCTLSVSPGLMATPSDSHCFMASYG